MLRRAGGYARVAPFNVHLIWDCIGVPFVILMLVLFPPPPPWHAYPRHLSRAVSRVTGRCREVNVAETVAGCSSIAWIPFGPFENKNAGSTLDTPDIFSFE